MALGTSQTPSREMQYSGGALIERLTPATVTVGSSGTVLTAAQLLKKIIPINCTDAGTLTLPTATLIRAAAPGIDIGDVFEFSIVNYGDSTATLTVGTGITNLVIDSEDAILTIDTHIGTRWALICTGVANPSDPSTSDAFNLMLLATSTCTS